MAAATALAWSAAPAQAAFSVSPTVIDVRTAPGRVVSGAFEVTLRGEPRRFTVQPQALGQDVHGAFTFGPPERSRFSAATWLQPVPATFRGAPDRIQPVEYRIRVPRDAEPGDHAASLTVRRAAVAQPGGAAIVQAVAVRLTIRVAGRAKRRAALADLRSPRLAAGGPVTAAVTVRNTGNQRLDFDRSDRGELAIRDGDRRAAATHFTGVLYPGERREFRASWLDPPMVGSGRVEARLAAAQPASLARTVLLVPWRQVLALGLVVLAAGLLATGRRRRVRR